MVVCRCIRLVPEVSPGCFMLYSHLEQHLFRCDARPKDLDSPDARMRSHKKTNNYVQYLDPKTLWDDYGIRSDVVVTLDGYLDFIIANTHAAVYGGIPSS
jgi:hypothetical protein